VTRAPAAPAGASHAPRHRPQRRPALSLPQSRDDAYRVITAAWSRCSSYAKLYMGANPHTPDEVDPGLPTPTRGALSPLNLSSLAESPTKRAAAAFEGEDDDSSESDAGDLVFWSPLHRAVPAADEALKVVASATLPCGCQDLCDKFLRTESGFWERFYTEIDEFSNVTVTDWQENSALGLVRSLEFVRRLKDVPMGPNETRCIQTQRCRQFRGSNGLTVLLETEQEQLDVPFGDAFKVVLRWEFTERVERSRRVEASVSLDIPFSKWCMVKGMIISRTTADVAASCRDILQKMSDQLAPREALQSKMVREIRRKLSQRVSTNVEVQALIDRIPTEYRADVSRMLQITVDESLSQEVAGDLQDGGLYDLLADGVDLLLSAASWVLSVVFKRPYQSVAQSLPRRAVVQALGGAVHVAFALQTALLLWIFISGSIPGARRVAVPQAPCEAQVRTIEALMGDFRAMKEAFDALAQQQPVLARAAAGVLRAP